MIVDNTTTANTNYDNTSDRSHLRQQWEFIVLLFGDINSHSHMILDPYFD